MYYVYQHINKINDKRYIGITKQNPESRWGVDGVNYKSSPYFYAAIQKYGWDNFEHEILFDNFTREEACAKEIELIAYFSTQDKRYGYNIMEGGSAPTIPEEIRKVMSEKMQGNKNGLGHPCSEEKKQKIGQSKQGSPGIDTQKCFKFSHLRCSFLKFGKGDLSSGQTGSGSKSAESRYRWSR